jgi:hypothetical protein
MKRLLILAVVLVLGRSARAEDRNSAADAMTKLGTSAESLGKTAKASEDRGARKKFAPKATEIADDLAALAKRTRKDVPLKTISTELADIDKDATALVDAADEVEDKTDRKNYRAQAQALEQGVAAIKKTIDTLATASDKPAAGPKPVAMKADAFKTLLAAVGDANTDADKVSVARAAAGNYFTAAQVGQLMDLLNTEMPKVDLAAALWSHLVDPNNGFVIFGKLELAGSKAELHRRVG